MNPSKLLLTGLLLLPLAGWCQTQGEETRKKSSRLQIGGYGEVAYTREFFSDNVYRYSNPGRYKNDPSHGRFDVPHAVIYLSYDFGKGWKMSSEIEFEHLGTGSAVEKEYSEGGEWESEVERGGEVELEQFWLEKSFCKQFNVRLGHIVVPVGLTNAHHEPLNFFTVYRPEGEATIMPCTWHETGISLWGRTKHWRYEIQLLPGLDALNFSRENWIKDGSASMFEFKVANKYAVAARVDNYSIPGLRMAVSGYYGHSIDNSLTRDANGMAANLKGAVAIGSFDFTYDAHNWIVRGNFDYGHLSDAAEIKSLKGGQSTSSPYNTSEVGEAAIAYGLEAGYDVFSQISKLRERRQQLYVFGRYEYYNPYIRDKEKQLDFGYTAKDRMAIGLNYLPIPEIALKAEYSHRFLKSPYNNEPSVSLGIAYQGFFTK